jgi:hypothetical protein
MDQLTQRLEMETLRPLAGTERYFWLSDQNSPKHFLIAAQVRGTKNIAAWRTALDTVQRRHPLLQAGISLDRNGAAHFTRHAEAPIPLRVVRRGAGRSWEQEAAREIETPFELADAPLLRMVLVHDAQVSNILLAAHHSIGDGLSLAHFIRDLLEALSGAALPVLPLSPSQEDRCTGLGITPRLPDPGFPVAAFGAYKYQPWRGRALSIRSLNIPAELTGSLRTRARQERTTVHCALTTALLLAACRLNEALLRRPIRVTQPVNTRGFLGLGYDFGCAVLCPTWQYTVQKPTKFWDLARRVSADLATVRAPQAIAGSLGQLEEFVHNATVADVAALELQVSGCDLLISNLGALNFAPSYNDLVLEGLWGPSSLQGSEGEQMVGAATLHGGLNLLHTSFKPLPSFLETGVAILSAALDD